MNKRVIISVLLIGLLAFGAGIGTFASFSRTFNSVGNTIAVDEFKLNGEGVIENGNTKTFGISGFAPGDVGMYQFKVRRETQLPVVYDVTVETTGQLPLNFKLNARNQNGVFEDYVRPVANNKVEYLGIPQDNSYGTDFFALKYSWPFEGDSNGLWGKTDQITIRVVARQIQRDNVKFAAVYVRDKDVTPVQYSQTSCKATVDQNGELVALEGYDNYLGKITYSNGTFTAEYNWTTPGEVVYKGLSPNSTATTKIYQFANASQRKHIEVTLPN